MRVLLGLLLFVGVRVVEAQQAGSAAEPAANSEAIVGLLKLSHDQDSVLSVPVRLYTLRMQVQAVQPFDAELARVWAEEMFHVSEEGTATDGESAQQFSLGMLASTEPERALIMLHSMKLDTVGPGHSFPAPKLPIITKAFTAIAERDGASAMPKLEEEATRFGLEGQYPYDGVGRAAVQSVNKDWGKDNDHAAEVVKEAFERMFARYSRESHGYPDDFEFGQMLGVVSGALPPEVVRPAVHALVKNLLAMDAHQYEPVAEVLTNDGHTLKSENGSDAGILVFGGLIQRVDPEFAQELETTRPGLRNLGYTKDGTQSSIRLGWKNLHSQDKGEDARQQAVNAARVNPDAAMAKAAQLPNDERLAGTKLDMARGMAENDPEKAAQLIEDAGDKTDDDAVSVNIASARAFVAAAEGKNEEMHEYLRQGFASADRVFAAQKKTGYLRLVAGLPQMVQLGAQYDLDMTTAFVQSLPASYGKALLFFGMANALEGAGGVHRRVKAE